MDDLPGLDGRVAVVTGAGAGLGRAESLALARAGARLVLNDVASGAAEAVAAEIAAAGGQAVVAAGDVGEWETGSRLMAAALGAYGRLDILVNNAGVLRDRMIFSMSEQEWDTVLRVHLRGHFVTTRFATAWWREQSKQAGGPVYARIVNTSSEAFLLGSAGQPNYAAAKAGIAALTVTTARGCARYGVRANAICPRARTAMTAELMGPPTPGTADPLAPEHVAPLVVHLASPAGEAINGEVFVVHGGVAAVLDPPRIRATYTAAEHGSPDGMWTQESVQAALAGLSSGAGFMCEDTLALATETIGFPAAGSGGATQLRLRPDPGTGRSPGSSVRTRPPPACTRPGYPAQPVRHRAVRHRAAAQAATSRMPIAASPRPSRCSRCSLSPSTTRASSTVTPGYSEASTTARPNMPVRVAAT